MPGDGLGGLLTVKSENIVHVSRGTVSVDARVNEQYPTTDSGQGAQGAQSCRAAPNDNGIKIDDGRGFRSRCR